MRKQKENIKGSAIIIVILDKLENIFIFNITVDYGLKGHHKCRIYNWETIKLYE